MGYINKHHPDVLKAFAESFSELGKIKAKKNAWTGGSYEIDCAKITNIDTKEMELEVTVVERQATYTETVKFDLGKRLKVKVGVSPPPLLKAYPNILYE
jgi:hypothetical protein